MVRLDPLVVTEGQTEVLGWTAVRPAGVGLAEQGRRGPPSELGWAAVLSETEATGAVQPDAGSSVLRPALRRRQQCLSNVASPFPAETLQ